MAEPDSLAAVLIRVAEHSERIGALDAREAAHAREVTARLDDLLAAVAELRGAVSDQAEVVAGLAGLDQRVARLAGRLAALGVSGDDGDGDGPPDTCRSRRSAGERRARRSGRRR